MLAQIAIHTTDRHPYMTQLVSFFISLLPVLMILALIVAVQFWRIRRNRHKARSRPH